MRTRLLIISTAILIFSGMAKAQSIDAVWNEVKLPPSPELQAVKIDSANTALLILDIEERTCNLDRRPRCLETVPKIAALMARARAAKVPVIYSLTSKGTPDTILPQIKPTPDESIVQSSVDKFWHTDLEQILADKGITSVIVTGTAAHGAVLHTATAAGFRKLNVIVPVDCLSAKDTYIEQASVQLLLTGPGTRRVVKLTRSDLISFL